MPFGFGLNKPGRCMIVAEPFWRYAIASVPPSPEAAPLLDAIRKLDESQRPFRIVSHETEDGLAFNASFFDSSEAMNTWLQWLSENALSPSGQFHGALKTAAKDNALPTPSSLLFGAGTKVLTDTRFGEYQLGMAARYSRQVLRDEEMLAEATEAMMDGDFEQRIAHCMQENGVAYFGRLVMLDTIEERTAGTAERAVGPAGSFLTVSRYGSLEDARRGTELVRQLLAPELDRWFSEHKMIMGQVQRSLEL